MKLSSLWKNFIYLSNEVFFITDLNGIFLDISPSIYKYSGYTREELIGKNISIGFLDPDDTKYIRKILNEKGKVEDLEIILKTKDGKIKFAKTNVEFYYKNNIPKYIIGVVSDITQTKLKFKEIKLQLNYLKNINQILSSFLKIHSKKDFFYNLLYHLSILFNSEHTLIVKIDEKENIVKIESRITKKELHDFVDNLKTDFHHLKKFEKEIKFLKENKILISYYNNPNKILTKENIDYHHNKWKIKSALWYLIKIGEINYILTFFNIIEHKIWEEEEIKLLNYLENIFKICIQRISFYEELNKISSVITNMNAITVITDLNGRIVYVNPYFEKITGYSKNEVIGKNLNILKSGLHSKLFYKELWDTILSGKVWKGELKNKNKNGEFFYEQAVIFPLKENNIITGFAKVSINITKEKQLQYQLMGTDKIQTIGQVTANIAHDLNNILTIISGYNELLKIKK